MDDGGPPVWAGCSAAVLGAIALLLFVIYLIGTVLDW
jgi:hypothetical protein